MSDKFCDAQQFMSWTYYAKPKSVRDPNVYHSGGNKSLHTIPSDQAIKSNLDNTNEAIGYEDHRGHGVSNLFRHISSGPLWLVEEAYNMV